MHVPLLGYPVWINKNVKTEFFFQSSSAVRPKNRFCGIFGWISLRAHTFICLHETWLWVIRDTILLQECAHASWTCIRKEGRNSLVAQVLIRVWLAGQQGISSPVSLIAGLLADLLSHPSTVCHMQTCANKKAYCHIWTCVRTQETKGNLLNKAFFLDSSHDQCGERFTDAEAHSGQHESLCSCLQIDVVTTSICLNSGLFALLYVFISSFLPSTQNVAVCLRLMSWLDNKHAL